MDLYELSDTELLNAYKDSVEAVREQLMLDGATYATLAAEIGVREDSLKKFVFREDEVLKSGRLRRGAVFSQVYKKLVERSDILRVPDDRELSSKQRRVGYRYINSILGVDGASMRIAERTLLNHGEFICLRNSTNKEYVAVSELSFSNLGTTEDPVWEFNHAWEEGDRSQSCSDGPVILMGRTLYLFGDVQLGRSIEVMFLHVPVGNSYNLTGLMFTHDDDGVPMAAKFALVPVYDQGRTLELLKNDIRRISEAGFMTRAELARARYGEDESFGINLLKQLKIDSSETVLRMSQERIFQALRLNP